MTKLKRKIVNLEIPRPYLADKIGKTLAVVSNQINNTDKLKVIQLKEYAQIINEFIENNELSFDKVEWKDLAE